MSGIIVPIEESEWISPMVVQPKKTGDIRICVDLRNLNAPMYMIHSLHPLPMKYWKMWVDVRPTHSQMDSQDIIKSRFVKKIKPRQCL
jgi:hypothetical protein